MIWSLSRFLPTRRELWENVSQSLMSLLVRRTSQRSSGQRACSRRAQAKSSETFPCCFSDMNLFMKSSILMNPCLSLWSSWRDHSTLVCGEKCFSISSLRIPQRCLNPCTRSSYLLHSSQQLVLPFMIKRRCIYQSSGLGLCHGP